ncbi:lysylphosphatidylglycerol synthase domain-containing protein [Propionibacteriaceae bacterium Y1923]|uniref:lysylphosphatidylglycerol synthase domain-containing protein n=1 Tax=Aestuariimicrobium sp. Y1814 TaxID=3418742 RepID=UPI003C1499F8
MASTPPAAAQDRDQQASFREARRRGWVIRLLLLALSVAVVVALVRLYRRIDFDLVWGALGLLEWWHGLVLLGVLVVRQFLNAAPLAVYIRSITLVQALLNDLSAYSASMLAPPPSDMVLRVARFKSWGVPVPIAVAGTTVNAMTMFIVRFGVPLLGFLIVPLTTEDVGWRWADLLSLLVCAALVIGLLLVVRGEQNAATIGLKLGRVLARVRRSVDPEAMSQSFRNFQGAIAEGFPRKFPRALAVTLAMVLVDLAMLTLTIRFLGVDADTLPLGAIAVAFLFAYPLTLFPFQGIGVMDAAIMAAVVGTAGEAITEPVIAALLIWRTYTVAGPFLMGLGALALWRRTSGPMLSEDEVSVPPRG